MKIQDSSKIYDQDALIDAFSSEVTFQSSTISDLTLSKNCVVIVGSSLELTDMLIEQISNPDNVQFILLSLNSQLLLSNIEYTDSDSILFHSISSSVTSSKLAMTNINDVKYLFSMYDSHDIHLSDLKAFNSSSVSNNLIDIQRSRNMTFKELEFTENNQIVIMIIRSTTVYVLDSNFTNDMEAIKIQHSSAVSIQNSYFVDNGDANSMNGGAVEIFNSVVNITNSVFTNNTAVIGGAVNFDCNSLTMCDLSISNTTFEMNSAESKGGAIYYGYKPPTLTNLTKIGNSAPYGPDLASYPVKIRMFGEDSDDITLKNVGPGISNSEEIKLVLMDNDNQIMVLENTRQIIISSPNTTLVTVSGYNSNLLKAGVVTFDNLILSAEIDSKNVTLQASSKAINTSKLNKIYQSEVSSNEVSANFRNCIAGEFIESSNTCRECSSGTYSIVEDATQCSACMENAV